MSVDIRESYNLKKIQKFNNIDQTHNMDQLKDVIIKSEKIQKPNQRHRIRSPFPSYCW